MPDFTRRERQIMDVLHRQGHATAQEVLESIANPPSYSAVRALLRLLEMRGHVNHISDGRRYIFTPVVSKSDAREAAVKHLLDTFFEGSAEAAIRALAPRLSADERQRVRSLME
jgi:predicted transcriptional regulator